MEKKFDVTLKSLLEDSPEDWPILAGIHEPKVEAIDADVSTISGAADKVLRLHGPPPWLMHFEFQAGPDASLPCRANVYNAALEDRHDLPVASVLVLLRPQANLSVLTGIYERRTPGAPRVRDRGRLGRWWTAVYVLMGMRYDDALINQLLQGVLGMKESVTYQAIVQEGLAEGLAKGRTEGALAEARKLLLQLGQDRFGTAAPADIVARVEAIQDLLQLEQLTRRVFPSQSWEELLPAPLKPQRRKSSRR